MVDFQDGVGIRFVAVERRLNRCTVLVADAQGRRHATNEIHFPRIHVAVGPGNAIEVLQQEQSLGVGHVGPDLHADPPHVDRVLQGFPKGQGQLLGLGLPKIGLEERLDVVQFGFQHAVVRLHDGGAQDHHAQGKVPRLGGPCSGPCMRPSAARVACATRHPAVHGQAVVGEHLAQPIAHDAADGPAKGPSDGATNPFGVGHQAWCSWAKPSWMNAVNSSPSRRPCDRRAKLAACLARALRFASSVSFRRLVAKGWLALTVTS